MPGLIRTQSIVDISIPFYSTTFSATENPLSESGLWINGQTTGVDWGNMRTTGGNAIGTLATTFHDNTALFTTPWPDNQYVETVVFRGSPNASFAPEVEHRLRSSLSANVNTGYEVGYGLKGSSDSYLIIVRWNGPVTDFTYLLNGQVGSAFVLADGDVVRSQIVGPTISTFVNGVLKGSVNITSIGGTVYNSGKPGIGTNADTGGSGSLDQYGWKSFQTGVA